MNRTLSYIFLLLSISVLLLSCDSGDDQEAIEKLIDDYIVGNNLQPLQTGSGLYYIIENEGSGSKVSSTEFVDFDIKGEVLGGGIFSNTFNDDENSVRFYLENTNVPALLEGLQLLGTGGKVTLIAHPDLAFGDSGTSSVPGNSVVIFELEVLGMYEDDFAYSENQLTEYIADNNLIAERTPSGLYVVIEEMGSDTMPTSNQTVLVHYHGYFLNGNVFDSSIDLGTPVQFALNGVIAGWTEGIPHFGEGGSGKLLIPSHLAYGSAGNPSIGPYTPIAFDVQLLEILE